MRGDGDRGFVTRRLRAVVVVVVLAAVGGCGGTPATHAHARRAAPHHAAVASAQLLFEGHCSQCHALIHPARHPELAGPDLGRLHLTAAEVRDRIMHGGPGMPSMPITQAQVDLLAPYVEAASQRLGHMLPHVTPRIVKARQVFRAQCGMCHRLTDAGMKGDGASVDFDVSPWNAHDVRGAVVTGFAFMPSLTLSRAELERLARYVASVAGRRAG